MIIKLFRLKRKYIKSLKELIEKDQSVIEAQKSYITGLENENNLLRSLNEERKHIIEIQKKLLWSKEERHEMEHHG